MFHLKRLKKIINYLLFQFDGRHQVIIVCRRVTDRTLNSRDLPKDIYEWMKT